jgi:hypothetical protein
VGDDLKQLKYMRVLFDELFGETGGLGLWVGRIRRPEEVDSRFSEAAIVLKFETQLLCWSDDVERRSRR